MERTLVLVKPDAVSRRLVGEILARYERKGLAIVALRQLVATAEVADEHYAEHVGKDWYPGLRDFITSGPLVAAVVEGDDAVACVRALNGKTNPVEALPGTIRGDYCTVTQRNAVHGSDSVESAAREIAVWFPELAG